MTAKKVETMSNNSVLIETCKILGGALLAGCTFWLGYGQKLATHEQVETKIIEKLGYLGVTDIKDNVKEVKSDIQSIKIDLSKISTKMEMLIDKPKEVGSIQK